MVRGVAALVTSATGDEGASHRIVSVPCLRLARWPISLNVSNLRNSQCRGYCHRHWLRGIDWNRHVPSVCPGYRRAHRWRIEESDNFRRASIIEPPITVFLRDQISSHSLPGKPVFARSNVRLR